jgi:hypothetical protein
MKKYFSSSCSFIRILPHTLVLNYLCLFFSGVIISISQQPIGYSYIDKREQCRHPKDAFEKCSKKIFPAGSGFPNQEGKNSVWGWRKGDSVDDSSMIPDTKNWNSPLKFRSRTKEGAVGVEGGGLQG